MAVVKVNYVKGNRPRAKETVIASVDYMAHRVNKEGERVSRTLFGHDGPMDMDQAFKMIEEAGRDINFFRIMISPDPDAEDADRNLDLWTLTQQTILRLEQRLGRSLQFVAAEHNDQTEIRHVHSIVLIPGRLTVADLRTLRAAATGAALARQQEIVQEQAFQLEPQGFDQMGSQSAEPPNLRAEPGLRPSDDYSCPVCGGAQAMMRLPGGILRCPGCRLVLSQGFGLERQPTGSQLSL